MPFVWLTFTEYLVCITIYVKSFQMYYLSNAHIYPVRHCYSTHFIDEQTKAESRYMLLSMWEMAELKTLPDPPDKIHVYISRALLQALEMGR